MGNRMSFGAICGFFFILVPFSDLLLPSISSAMQLLTEQLAEEDLGKEAIKVIKKKRKRDDNTPPARGALRQSIAFQDLKR